MQWYGDDIYTEPSGVDGHTLTNLGPLRGMAVIFEGTRSLNINPKAAGPERQKFVERIELPPIDRMIPPDAQRAMSKRAGSTVVEVKASHAVYVSQPRAVVTIVEQAAKGIPAMASR